MRTNFCFLSNALLLFQIRDYDLLTKDDIIAYGHIPLRECVQKVGEWCEFTVNLTLDGLEAGILQGSIKIIYETFGDKKKEKKGK